MVHWWLRTWPGHTRVGYPPVAPVVTDAGPVDLANRQQAVADLARDAWGGGWWTVPTHDADGDGCREYDDAVPVIATTLELLAEYGPLGPVWWRYGGPGRHSLLDALDNPDNRAAYDRRQKREKKARQDHCDLMWTLACADRGQVPKEESTWEYGPDGNEQWTRRPGGRCWTCHQEHTQGLEREAEEQLEAARGGERRVAPVLAVPGLCRRVGGLAAGTR
ncbi:hypothetical protein [Kitasatospora sp. NPDC006786]|uniref:hypothetical protein n=1 Tax=unclassified Kitasatospora TaxID=2633591 RepID=UPI0033C3276D